MEISLRAISGGGFDVGGLNCYGAMMDLYDWSYGAPKIKKLGVTFGDPKEAAKVQAGFANLTFAPWLDAGRVFTRR